MVFLKILHSFEYQNCFSRICAWQNISIEITRNVILSHRFNTICSSRICRSTQNSNVSNDYRHVYYMNLRISIPYLTCGKYFTTDLNPECPGGSCQRTKNVLRLFCVCCVCIVFTYLSLELKSFQKKGYGCRYQMTLSLSQYSQEIKSHIKRV